MRRVSVWFCISHSFDKGSCTQLYKNATDILQSSAHRIKSLRSLFLFNTNDKIVFSAPVYLYRDYFLPLSVYQMFINHIGLTLRLFDMHAVARISLAYC